MPFVVLTCCSVTSSIHWFRAVVIVAIPSAERASCVAQRGQRGTVEEGGDLLDSRFAVLTSPLTGLIFGSISVMTNTPDS